MEIKKKDNNGEIYSLIIDYIPKEIIDLQNRRQTIDKTELPELHATYLIGEFDIISESRIIQFEFESGETWVFNKISENNTWAFTKTSQIRQNIEMAESTPSYKNIINYFNLKE